MEGIVAFEAVRRPPFQADACNLQAEFAADCDMFAIASLPALD